MELLFGVGHGGGVFQGFGPALPYGNVDQDNTADQAHQQAEGGIDDGKAGTLRSPAQLLKNRGHGGGNTVAAGPAPFKRTGKEGVDVHQGSKDQHGENHGHGKLHTGHTIGKAGGADGLFIKPLGFGRAGPHHSRRQHHRHQHTAQGGPAVHDFFGDDIEEKGTQQQAEHTGQQGGGNIPFLQEAHLQTDERGDQQQNTENCHIQQQVILCAAGNRFEWYHGRTSSQFNLIVRT